MLCSDSIAALAAALSAAQAELKNPVFDSVNPHFKSRFATLATVRDTITPVLSRHGLSVVQLATNDPEGRPCVETVLAHASGEWISSRLTVPVGKADAHGTGSAITYARRYALMAIVNVVGDQDEDANGAVGQQEKPVVRHRQNPPKPDAGLLAKATAAARGGIDAFRAFWKELPAAQRTTLEPFLDDLKAAAENAQEAAAA